MGTSRTDARFSIGDPSLSLEFHNLRADDLRQLPPDILGLPVEMGLDAYQAIESLRSIYCGTIGYDYGHIRIPEERHWLSKAAESGRFRAPQSSLDENRLLEILTQVEAFELFLHRLYPGKTRFSIQGLDMLVPMLDEIVAAAASEKICAILVGHLGVEGQ